MKAVEWSIAAKRNWTPSSRRTLKNAETKCLMHMWPAHKKEPLSSNYTRWGISFCQSNNLWVGNQAWNLFTRDVSQRTNKVKWISWSVADFCQENKSHQLVVKASLMNGRRNCTCPETKTSLCEVAAHPHSHICKDRNMNLQVGWLRMFNGRVRREDSIPINGSSQNSDIMVGLLKTGFWI